MPDGPLFENLLKLRDMMPKLAKGLASKKLIGGARKMLPTKVCKMCDDIFDVRLADPKTPLEYGLCQRCQALLDDGWTGARHGNRRLWIKLPAEIPVAGKFYNVVKSEMDALIVINEKLTKANGENPPTTAPELAPVRSSCPRTEPEAGSGPCPDPLPNPS